MTDPIDARKIAEQLQARVDELDAALTSKRKARDVLNDEIRDMQDELDMAKSMLPRKRRTKKAAEQPTVQNQPAPTQ